MSIHSWWPSCTLTVTLMVYKARLCLQLHLLECRPRAKPKGDVPLCGILANFIGVPSEQPPHTQQLTVDPTQEHDQLESTMWHAREIHLGQRRFLHFALVSNPSESQLLGTVLALPTSLSWGWVPRS